MGVETIAQMTSFLDINFYGMINWLTGIILVGFWVIVYTGGSGTSARAYARNIFWFSFWAFSIALYYSLDAERNKDLLFILLKHLHWIAIPIFTTFFYFTLVYPDEDKRYPKIKWVLVALSIVMLYPHFFTKLVVEGIAFGPRILDRGPMYAAYSFPLFHLPYALFVIGGHLVLLWKIFKSRGGDEERRVLHTFWASTLLFLPASIFVLFMPAEQNFDNIPFGPPITLLWVFYTAYATMRHKILRIKVFAPVMFVLALMGILFVNIFLAV